MLYAKNLVGNKIQQYFSKKKLLFYKNKLLKKSPKQIAQGFKDGGGGGIRTHERFNPLPVFKTGAFNHSATPPS